MSKNKVFFLLLVFSRWWFNKLSQTVHTSKAKKGICSLLHTVRKMPTHFLENKTSACIVVTWEGKTPQPQMPLLPLPLPTFLWMNIALYGMVSCPGGTHPAYSLVGQNRIKQTNKSKHLHAMQALFSKSEKISFLSTLYYSQIQNKAPYRLL